MKKLDREQATALAALCLVLLASVIVPALFFNALLDASQSLADERQFLQRVERSHRPPDAMTNANRPPSVAPASAFLNAQTSSLASAQLEAYLSRLAESQQANLVSTGVQPAHPGDMPEIVRVQATLDLPYAALQEFLYKLETGTPYIFVDTMTLQEPYGSTRHVTYMSIFRVTFNLHALWHRTPR